MVADAKAVKLQCQGDSAVDLTAVGEAPADAFADSKGVKPNVSYAQLLKKDGAEPIPACKLPAADKTSPSAPVSPSQPAPESPLTPAALHESPTASEVSSPVTSQPAEDADFDGFQTIKNPKYHRNHYKHQDRRDSRREQRGKDRKGEGVFRSNRSSSPKGHTPSRQGSFDAKTSPETKCTSRSSTAVSPALSDEKPGRQLIPPPAPAPAVNIWEVRKEEAAKKAFSATHSSTSSGEGSPVENIVTTNDAEKAREEKPVEFAAPTKGAKFSRRSSVASNISRPDPVLSFDDPSVWPSVAVSVKEKEQHPKHESRLSDGEEHVKRAVGKSKWIPYTATITHSTPLPGHHFYTNRHKDKRLHEKNIPNHTGNNNNHRPHHTNSNNNTNNNRNHSGRSTNDDSKRSASVTFPNNKPHHQQRRRSSNNSHPHPHPHQPHHSTRPHLPAQQHQSSQPHHAQPELPAQPSQQLQQHAPHQQQHAPPAKAPDNGPSMSDEANAHGNAAPPPQGNLANGRGGPAYRGNNRRGRGSGTARPAASRMPRGRQPMVQAPPGHLQAAYPVHHYLPVAHAPCVDASLAYAHPGYGYPGTGLYMPRSGPTLMTVSGPPGVAMAIPPGAAAPMTSTGAPISPAVAFDADTLKYYILAQIEYYFSVQNLVRDAYFRRHMNSEGWVPLTVLASFNRIRLLTSDLALIRDALLPSPNLEVDNTGFRVRKRDGWAVWLFPENQRIPHPPMLSASAPAFSAPLSVPPSSVSQPLVKQTQGAGVASC